MKKLNKKSIIISSIIILVLAISAFAFLYYYNHIETYLFSDNNFVFRDYNGEVELYKFTSEDEFNEITIPSSFNGKKVTKIGECAFFGANIKSLVLPKTITKIGDNAFESMAKLTDIKLNDGLKSIGKSSFKMCVKLNKITVPNTVKDIGANPFICSSVKEIDLGNNNNFVLNDGVLYTSDYKSLIANIDCKLENITFPKGLETVCENAFYGKNTELKKIVFPDTLKRIEAHAFENSENLLDISFPKSLNYIGLDAFENVAWFLYQEKDYVTVNNILIRCNVNNDTFEIPNGVTKVMCFPTKTTTINIPDSLEYIEPSFDMKNVTEINISENNKYFSNDNKCTLFNYDKTAIIKSYGDFSNITDYSDYDNLETYTVPDTVKSINEYAFSYSSVGKISLPKSLTNISNNAFDGDSVLNEIEIPNSVKSIGNETFAFCDNLEKVIIPESVTYIHPYAFENSQNGIKISAKAKSFAKNYKNVFGF